MPLRPTMPSTPRVQREAHALQRVGAAVVDVEALDDEHRRRARFGRRARCRLERQAISACLPCRSPAPAASFSISAGVPVRSTRPLCITVTRSTTRSAMSRSCSIRTKLMCAGSEREQRDQLAPLGRRQAGGRLVEQDQARRAGQRHADLELALLAVRQVGDALVGDVAEAGALEQVVRWPRCDAWRARGRPQAEAAAGDAAHREEEVVAHRQVAKQQRGLVGAAQALADALVRRQLGDVLAEEMDPPGGGREVAGDGVEQRRLAGAVGAEDGVLLAGGDRQRDVVDRAQRAERARHAASAPARRSRRARGRARAARRRARAPAAARAGEAGRSRPRPRAVAQGQAGTSREPIWNSSFFMPSSWSTLSTLLCTLSSGCPARPSPPR